MKHDMFLSVFFKKLHMENMNKKEALARARRLTPAILTLAQIFIGTCLAGPNDVWLPGEDYTNATTIMNYLTHPFATAGNWLAPLGGATFVYAGFSLLTLAYTYLHFKSALAGGVVALLLASIGLIVPEVAQFAWALTVFGLLSIAYKLIKWGVG